MTRRTVMFAATEARKIQSSPITRGTAAEPIDIDLTPRPIRRVLFPSPRGGEVQQANSALKEKINDTLLPSFVRRSPRINKTRNFSAENGVSSIITVDGTVERDGKENMTPRAVVHNNHDDDDIFGDFDSMPPPMTPTPKRRSERILLRTPGMTATRTHTQVHISCRNNKSRSTFDDTIHSKHTCCGCHTSIEKQSTHWFHS